MTTIHLYYLSGGLVLCLQKCDDSPLDVEGAAGVTLLGADIRSDAAILQGEAHRLLDAWWTAVFL